jgi:hypothetical protein
MGLQDLTPQLRTRLSRVEWYVGLFLGVTALLMVIGFGAFLKRTAEARGWFVVEVPYFTYLPDASGLKPGSPVNLMGFKVGEVTEVTAISLAERLSWDHHVTNQFNVFVRFVIRADGKSQFPGYVNSDAQVKLSGLPVDLLGGSVLEVTQGTTNGVLTFEKAPNGQPGVLMSKFAILGPSPERTNKYLKYEPVKTSGGYYLRLDESETMTAQVQRVMSRLDHIAGTVDGALPPMLEELQGTLETVRRALPGLTNNLDAVLANTRELTAQLRDAWPMLTNNLDLTLGTTRELASNINLTIPTLASNVNLTLTNVNVLLMGDTNVTANASTLVSNVNQVITRHWLFRSAFKEKVEKKPKEPSDPSTKPKRQPPRMPRSW